MVISPYARKRAGLTPLQCQGLLRDCGIVARDQAERQEFLALAEELDEEGLGEVPVGQVEALVYRVAAQQRHACRELERRCSQLGTEDIMVRDTEVGIITRILSWSKIGVERSQGYEGQIPKMALLLVF